MNLQTGFDLMTSSAFDSLSVKAMSLSGNYITIMLGFFPYVLVFWFTIWIWNWLLWFAQEKRLWNFNKWDLNKWTINWYSKEKKEQIQNLNHIKNKNNRNF